MYRKKVSGYKDRAKFRRTAIKKKSINNPIGLLPRGGIRL